MSNDQEILDKIKDIRKTYKSETEDKEEENTMSFLDNLNDLVRCIFNDSSLTVYDAFDKDKMEKWKKRRFSKFLKNIFNKNFFYLSLLIAITAFLVSEAVVFYTDGADVGIKTYAKAILTELCFIFLSGYRSNTNTEKITVGTLRVSIFCLMLFVITSKTFLNSAKDTSNTSIIQEQVAILEKQIKEKETSIAYYRDVKQWPTTTKQLIKEKDELVKKLMELKERQAAGSNIQVSDLIRYKAYGNAFFRVLLLFISVLITRRIFSF